MPLGCVIYIPETMPLTAIGVRLCIPVVTIWYSRMLYIYIRRGVSEVARFNYDGQFSGASGCEASDDAGLHVFFLCV